MVNRFFNFFVAGVILLCSASVMAQSGPQSQQEAARRDTVMTPDTLGARDSSTVTRPRPVERNQLSRPVEMEKKPVKPRLSIIDSLQTHFLSNRQDVRRFIDQSNYHDAGDYARHDPAFWSMQYHETPIRSTVAPFGLAGDHFAYIRNGQALEPFDHVPEPDGSIDANDLPTATDAGVYMLPGPAGMLFGGKQAVASMVMRPVRPDSLAATSAFLVDKGNYGFSHARARYAKRFTSGKDLSMSLDYRLASGFKFGRHDNTYHYTADFTVPIGENAGVLADGWIYDRGGDYPIRPDSNATAISRNRIDRHLQLGYFRQNADHTRLDQLSYRHLRQGSNLGNNLTYKGRFNLTGHGITVERNLVTEKWFIRVSGAGDYLKYDQGTDKYDRVSGSTNFDIAQRKPEGWHYGAHADLDYTESFRPTVSAAVLVMSESSTRFTQLSVGYNERVPTLHEMNLPLQRVSVYGSPGDYIEYGNPDLKIERQLAASVETEFGVPAHRLNFSLTGGKLFYGIDWLPDHDTLAGVETFLFTPINHDVTFADATVRGEWQYRDLLQMHGGASYHVQNYAGRSDWPYTPDYQFFAGAQVHYYWAQKLINFWAYGEVVYVGPYETYSGNELGATPVFNSKLSFQMGSFRFNLTYLNLLTNAYQPREALISAGRTITWGFVWNFLD